MGIISYMSQGTLGASLLPKRYDIDIYQGDSFDLIISFKDSASNAIDLTGFIGVVQFKDSNNLTVVATPTVTTNANSVVGDVEIALLDTTVLAEGTYLWDLQLTDGGGRVRTYIGGQVTVTGDISQ